LAKASHAAEAAFFRQQTRIREVTRSCDLSQLRAASSRLLFCADNIQQLSNVFLPRSSTRVRSSYFEKKQTSIDSVIEFLQEIPPQTGRTK
jgi:hypothetical protein